MIHLALGDENSASENLTRALAVNPHFHVLYADVAERKLQDIRNHQHAQ